MNAIKVLGVLVFAVAMVFVVMGIDTHALRISAFRHGYSLNGGAITISNVDFSERGSVKCSSGDDTPLVTIGKYQTGDGRYLIDISCPIGGYVREQIRTIKSKLSDAVCDEDFGLVSNAAGLARQFAKENGLIYKGPCK